MTTARDIIKLVYQSIETDIDIAQMAIEYAERETEHIIRQKELCEASNGHLVAESTYNNPLGYYHGIIFENKERINALRNRLNYWKSLEKRCIEEEAQDSTQKEEGDDE